MSTSSNSCDKYISWFCLVYSFPCHLVFLSILVFSISFQSGRYDGEVGRDPGRRARRAAGDRRGWRGRWRCLGGPPPAPTPACRSTGAGPPGREGGWGRSLPSQPPPPGIQPPDGKKKKGASRPPPNPLPTPLSGPRPKGVGWGSGNALDESSDGKREARAKRLSDDAQIQHRPDPLPGMYGKERGGGRGV